MSKGVRSEVIENQRKKLKERKKRKKQWLTEAKNKEYKIYPSCYSTIIHLQWYCSTMPKKITILQV